MRPLFFMLKSILVCEQDPCDQKYFQVLRRRRFWGFKSFEGIRMFVELWGLVLLLFVARVETCWWRSWINLRGWAFTSVFAFIVAGCCLDDSTGGASAWPSTRAWTLVRTSSLILSSWCWVQLPSILLGGMLYYVELAQEFVLRKYELLLSGVINMPGILNRWTPKPFTETFFKILSLPNHFHTYGENLILCLA